MSRFESEMDQVRRKRDEAAADATARGDDPFAAGIRAAFDHGIPDLQRNLPELRQLLDMKIDAASFALGSLVSAFAMQGLDVFQLAKMPQFEEIPRYLAKVKDI